MIALHATHSQASLTSTAYTDVSTSTNQTTFIGTTGGRALEVVGRYILGNIESVMIRRAFATIKNFFPHQNQHSCEHIDELYENLFEFARSDISPPYPSSIVSGALQLICAQIESHQTQSLLAFIQRVKNPKRILSTIFTALNFEWPHSRQDAQRRYIAGLEFCANSTIWSSKIANVIVDAGAFSFCLHRWPSSRTVVIGDTDDNDFVYEMVVPVLDRIVRLMNRSCPDLMELLLAHPVSPTMPIKALWVINTAKDADGPTELARYWNELVDLSCSSGNPAYIRRKANSLLTVKLQGLLTCAGPFYKYDDTKASSSRSMILQLFVAAQTRPLVSHVMNRNTKAHVVIPAILACMPTDWIGTDSDFCKQSVANSLLSFIGTILENGNQGQVTWAIFHSKFFDTLYEMTAGDEDSRISTVTEAVRMHHLDRIISLINRIEGLVMDAMLAHEAATVLPIHALWRLTELERNMTSKGNSSIRTTITELNDITNDEEMPSYVRTKANKLSHQIRSSRRQTLDHQPEGGDEPMANTVPEGRSMVSMASSILDPVSDTASLSPASPSSSFHPKSNGSKSPASSSTFETNGAAFAEYLKTWTDSHIARWLNEIKCSNQVLAFQTNDIRGDIVLELDQETLKEMGVTSIGDRLRIISAVKKLRQRCATRSSSLFSLEGSPRSQSRMFLNSDAPAISHGLSDSLDESPTSRLAGRLGTVRPPPLHITSSSSSDLPRPIQGEVSSARRTPPLRPLPQPSQNPNNLSTSSVPSYRPLPNTSTRVISPPSTNIRTPRIQGSREQVRNGSRPPPEQTDPGAFANSPLPPPPGSRAGSPFGSRSNSSTQIASAAPLNPLPPSRGSSRTPALNQIHTRNTSLQTNANNASPSSGLSPRPAAYTTSPLVAHSSSSASDSATRKVLFRFQLHDEGHTKMVDVTDCHDAIEVLETVLKKFGKSRDTTEDSESLATNGGLLVDGWAIHLDWGTGDGLGNPLTKEEVQTIIFQSDPDDPVHERGLTLRRRNTKRSKHLNTFLGEDVIPGHGASNSDTESGTGSPHRAKFGADIQKRPSVKRASAISVLSGLGVQNPERVLDPSSSPRGPGTPNSGGLKLPSNFRKFLGQRPPSEFITNHAADYFPAVEKKVLARTARNSIYRQSTISSRRGSYIPPLPSRSSQTDLSPNRSSVDLPPPVPEKPFSPNAATFPASKDAPPRVSISTETGDLKNGEEEPTPVNRKRLSVLSMNGSLDRPSSAASKRMSMMEIRSSVYKGSENNSLVTLDEVTASVERKRESRMLGDSDSWTGVKMDGTDPAFPSPAFSAVDLPEGEDEETEVDVEDEISDDDDDEETAIGDSMDEKEQNTKWIKGALIGAGSFGKVYLGMSATNGLLMAVKQVELPTGNGANEERKKQMVQSVESEIDLLKDLQHENIVQYLYSSIDDEFLNIFLEYVPGGSVTAMLRNYGAFEETLVRTFIRQILQGLSYLHSRNIIHRDIKGGNILVDTTGGIKISDFGISKKVGGASLLGKRMNRPSLQGTVFWMAPEVVQQKAHTPKADIWSVGCLSVEMLTGQHPWSQLTQMQAIFQLGNSAKPQIPADISTEAEDFIQQTFNLNWDERPSADELLKHPWITGKKVKVKPNTLEVPTL